MTGMRRQVPSGQDIYLCAIIACLYTYFGTFFLLACTAFLPEGEGAIALITILAGAFVFLVPCFFAICLVVAPIGCLFAVGLLAWVPASRWSGALACALTAVTVLSPLSLFGLDSVILSTPKALAAMAGILGVAALSGWYAQRQVLRWPDPRSRAS